MNYKMILEEQINELSDKQSAIHGKNGYEIQACEIAKTIGRLVEIIAILK